jgi:plastocyanin
VSSTSLNNPLSWFVVGVVSLAAFVLIGGFVMGIMMAGQMGGGMMGRAGDAPQTPFVTEGDVTVDIRGFDYFPRDLTIRAGSTVTWFNDDNVPHTATEDDKAWDSGVIGKDGVASITFDNPGEYSYYCTIHPSMKAKLTAR